MTGRPTRVIVSIDTEEDDWGSFDSAPPSVKNIVELPRLQELFERFGVRPTYFVNLAPLSSAPAVATLGEVAAREGVEIATHCHPWNTPPIAGPSGEAGSMMCALDAELNRAKIETVTQALETELGVRSRSFRTGRWGFGPSVARPLADLGYRIDSSVSPFIDWSEIGGPDYRTAQHVPYRFEPERPFEVDPKGSMVQVPTTVGFLRGEQTSANRVRTAMERSWVRRLKVIGVLDRMGFYAKRWLSPETSSGRDMVRLARTLLAAEVSVLSMTFHSCTLLPGATPFVRDRSDRQAFLASIEQFLSFCKGEGVPFASVSEVGAPLLN